MFQSILIHNCSVYTEKEFSLLFLGKAKTFYLDCSLYLTEINQAVWGGSGNTNRKWRNSVSLHSMCKAEAGSVPGQLLPWGE